MEVKVGNKFNYWEVVEIKDGKIVCLCTACNQTKKQIQKSWLVNQRTKSCGCIRKNLQTKPKSKDQIKQVSVGEVYNKWQVIGFTNKNGIICKCLACNKTTKTIKKNVLVNGRSKSCGCLESKDFLKTQIKVGDKFSEWTILESSIGKYFSCQCSCGEKRLVSYVDLVHEKSKSCGCKRKQFAEQTSLETFGTKHPHQSKEVKNQKQKTLMERYGVANSFELIDPSLGSKAELELLSWVQQFYPSAKKTWEGGKEVDIFIPELKLGIEFNGLFWHNENKVSRNYHLEKTKHFANRGIRIIHIFEHEWQFRKDQVKSFLLSAINQNQNRVAARKCRFIFTNDKQEIKAAQDLLEATHIQGKAPSPKYVINVYFQEMLLGVATFGKHHRTGKDWVLSRFVTKENFTIQGGLAKISKIASKHLNRDLVSWADFRLSKGDGYLKSGWIYEQLLAPDYFYHKGLQILSKQARQKSIVGTPEEMTEHEHALLEGFFRVYDCGKIRFRFLTSNN